MSDPKSIGRREFVIAAGAAVAATALPRSASSADPERKNSRIKKSLKFDMVQVEGSLTDKFKLLKELGFDGVELDSPTKLDKMEILRARDESGLVVSGTVNAIHWSVPLSDPDPKKREQAVAALKTALEETKTFGGTSVLLVPAVVKKDVSYDDAYKRSQAEIRKVLPTAEKTGIKIALENVWNNFLLSPLEMARYLDEFNSPLVCAHFDVGNVLRYGWPEHWIRVLGKRIFKLDVKEYSRKKMEQEGIWKGFAVEIGEGDCDWEAVMSALRDIDYGGWYAAEVPGGGRERLAEISRRMDDVLAM